MIVIESSIDNKFLKKKQRHCAILPMKGRMWERSKDRFWHAEVVQAKTWATCVMTYESASKNHEIPWFGVLGYHRGFDFHVSLHPTSILPDSISCVFIYPFIRKWKHPPKTSPKPPPLPPICKQIGVKFTILTKNGCIEDMSTSIGRNDRWYPQFTVE